MGIKVSILNFVDVEIVIRYEEVKFRNFEDYVYL